MGKKKQPEIMADGDVQKRWNKLMSGADARQEGGTHYKGEFTQEHWDYAWERGFDFFQYVITKYVERCWKKNGLEDLRKARHYLDKYIELKEKEASDKACAAALGDS